MKAVKQKKILRNVQAAEFVKHFVPISRCRSKEEAMEADGGNKAGFNAG
jgi:hypothetical protein